MAQKKAFVRYAQNKAVPGSLIVRTKAPKVGTWKEVPYDLCCGSEGELACTLKRNVSGFTYPATTGIFFQLFGGGCNEGLGGFNYFNTISDSIPEVNNINDLVQILNENFSFYGTFSVSGPTEISLALLSSLSNICTCTEEGGPFIIINNNEI
jgi:hypothetical protein